MRKLTHRELTRLRPTPEELREMPRFPIYALLDNVRSLYNVGSIFRTADAARVARLILSGYTPTPPRPEIEKTALGATRTVPWERAADPLEAIAGLRRAGVRICLVEQAEGARPYDAVGPADLPICLIVGNEIGGVGQRIAEAADMALEIPMYGMKQSLNAAVAFGIAALACARAAAGEGGPALSRSR